jgi:hypothetical protein
MESPKRKCAQASGIKANYLFSALNSNEDPAKKKKKKKKEKKRRWALVQCLSGGSKTI